MSEKAILAIEEALLSSMFTLRAIVELLIKKGLIQRGELEKELLRTENETIGAGKKSRRVYLEKRTRIERRKKNPKKINIEKRTGIERRE